VAQLCTGGPGATGPGVAIAPAPLAQAVRAGASSARGALADPKEGTILSVISAFADSLEHRVEITDVRTWFARALESGLFSPSDLFVGRQARFRRRVGGSPLRPLQAGRCDPQACRPLC